MLVEGINFAHIKGRVLVKVFVGPGVCKTPILGQKPIKDIELMMISLFLAVLPHSDRSLDVLSPRCR